MLGGGLVDLLVYAVILFVFIIALIKCILPVLRNRSLIRRAVRNIRAGDEAKQSWQEDDCLGKGVLNAHWSEYLNNLFFADGVYHNASNVEDYINEETVIYGPGRGGFADAVPGLLAVSYTHLSGRKQGGGRQRVSNANSRSGNAGPKRNRRIRTERGERGNGYGRNQGNPESCDRSIGNRAACNGRACGNRWFCQRRGRV